MKYKFTKEQIQSAVDKSLSIAQVCRELGIRPVGGNYKTVHSKLKLFEITTEHFTGAAWNVGDRFRKISRTYTDEQVFRIDSCWTNNGSVKRRLLERGYIIYQCNDCGITSWNNKPISLELNHINGTNTDNTIENLELLCPNCHSQTNNFRGRNKEKSSKSEKKQSNYLESLKE